MGRKKKEGFRQPKMLSSRVEQEDYDKFNTILKYRDGKKVQDVLNLFIREYISGNIVPSGSGFEVKNVE